jgi:acetolactate synthase small subunit
MKKTKHTPAPWAMRETPSGKAKIVNDMGFSIANTTAGPYEEQRANAAFIVRAVNSHEQMVSALADAIIRLTSAYTLLKCDDEFIEREVAIARAALATAEAA